MEANPIPRVTSVIEEGGPVTKVHQYTQAEAEANRAAQAEVRQEIWDAQWEKWNASLPEKFQGAYTEHPQILERLARMKTGKQGRGVASAVAIGDTGVGKTYLAVAYANQAIKAGYFKPSEVLFGSEAALLSAAANAQYADVEKAFTKLISGRYKMIIIDDAGRGTWIRDDMRAKVWSLVLDSLYASNRVVVVTTNLPSKELGEYIGEGAMDRLRAMVGYGVILMDDPQRRKTTEESLAAVRELSQVKPKA
jgi:DNA replication protein DnaC